MKQKILKGLSLTLPLLGTIALCLLTMHWLSRPCISCADYIMTLLPDHHCYVLPTSKSTVLRDGISSVLLILSITMIGLCHTMLSPLFVLIEKTIDFIPGIRMLYHLVQELFNTVFSSQSSAFKQVVLVPFPQQSFWTVGLLTKESSYAPHHAAVFIPAAPNCAHGFLMVFPKEQVLPISMSVKEAMQYIISAGTMAPSTIEIQGAL